MVIASLSIVEVMQALESRFRAIEASVEIEDEYRFPDTGSQGGADGVGSGRHSVVGIADGTGWFSRLGHSSHVAGTGAVFIGKSGTAVVAPLSGRDGEAS